MQAQGAGFSPRILLKMLTAVSFQSMKVSSLKIFGAGLSDALLLWCDCSLFDFVKRVKGELCAALHQSVVKFACRLLRSDFDFRLGDDVAGVNLLVEEEGGYAGAGFSVHNGPMDGGGAAVIWEEGGVERAEAGHGIDHFGQHSEGDHHEDVGVDGAQLCEELLRFEFFGL